MDLEQRPTSEKQLINTTVHNITWRGVTVTVTDRKTKQSKTLVDNIEGVVQAGSFYSIISRMSIPTKETNTSIKENAAP
jgi:hypothetical protein